MNRDPASTGNFSRFLDPARLPFFYGWIVVAVAFVTMAIAVNSRTAFSLLFPPILDEFGWARGTIAATFSIGFVVSTVLAPFIGMMMDRLGPRVILPMGGLLTSLGLVASTWASEPWHFYLSLGVLVVGGSTSIGYIGHTVFVPNWFDRKRGFAMGLAFSGVGIGSILLFPWMQQAIENEGWRYSVSVLAIIIMVFIVPLNFLFQRQRPAELGLEPDGGKSDDVVANAARKTGREKRVVDADWLGRDWTISRAMCTLRFWLLALSFFTAIYAWYAVQVHQTRYLIDIGISAESAALALGLVGLSGIVGQVYIGALSDRIGRELAWTLALMGYFLVYACLLLLHSWPVEWLMYLMVGLQGFLGYGCAAVFASIPAEIFPGKHYGSIFGVLGGTTSLGAAVGPWATGVFFDTWGNYNNAFIIAMVLCLVSVMSMWMASPRKVILVAGRARS